MARFFTSDFHLGSTNILKYAKRPFISAEDAATKLIDNCNEVAKWKTDVIFHAGDFYLRNVDRHDDIEDVNTLTADAKDYINFINARFILIEGNHDSSNIEADMKSMVIDLNHNYRNVYVSHFPSYHDYYHGPIAKFGRKIVLCGHVHDSWKVMWDYKKNVLNINIGCDVWNYRPVSDVQLTELIDFLTTQTQLFDSQKNVYWKQTDIDKAKIDYKKQIEAGRQQRKSERYAKKGITPEEAERRKIAAMKAKGLIS